MGFNFYKKFLFFIALIFVSIVSVHGQENDIQHKKGELLIQLNQLSEIGELLRAFPQLEKLEQEIKSFNIVRVGFDDSSIDEQKLFSSISKMPFVRNIQFNHLVSLRDSTPDDTQFNSQWSLNNTGQSGGVFDADIDAVEAWSISTGGLTARGDTIVVAVIDAGFDLTHPDISYWYNYNEIAGNGIDDDGNGYIDDLNGWNTYNNSGNITSDSHGTHVAGIVGAKGNNKMGVTGVNWNVKVMAIQGSSTDEATVIKAYSYVFEQRKLYDQTNGAKGAFIVATNASFGVDYGNPVNFPLWCGIYDSLGSVGVLSAGATANINIDIDQSGDIPTACSSDFLIAVTNTTSNDLKYSGAGYGQNTIDIGAPGTGVLSTVPGANYQEKTGTSMASPHVAGCIGLMFSAACEQFIDLYKQHPANYSRFVKNLLLNSADGLANLQGKTYTGGRLNLYKSLLSIQQNCDSVLGIREYKSTDILKVFPNPARDRIEFVFDKSESPFLYEIVLYNSMGIEVKKEINVSNNYVLYNDNLKPGIYYYQIFNKEYSLPFTGKILFLE